MDEFNRQLNNDLKSDIYEFNNKPVHADIRQLYKSNFDKIVSYIERSNPKLAVEDIATLDRSLTAKVIDNILLLKEINKAIAEQELTLSSIK